MLSLGFDGCLGALEFSKGEAHSGNGSCICKGLKLRLTMAYPGNNRTCRVAVV